MQQIESLKTNRDFRRLYGRGSTFVTPLFVLYAQKTRRKDIRLGLTVGKKLGGAVERNRAKRVLRAAFRNCSPHIVSGVDFVVVARTRILNAKSTDAAVLLRRQLKAGGFWCDDEPAC